MKKDKYLKIAEKAVKDWNEKYPIGTTVNVYITDGVFKCKTRTKSIAYIMCSTASVMLENVSGCWDLELLEVV